MKIFRIVLVLLLMAPAAYAAEHPSATGFRLKNLARIAGERDASLVGYGLVTGLAGTGDSPRSKETLQSVSNMLHRFGLNIPASNLYSRNVAAVMITAVLPPYARPGDKLDVNVSSIGDATSLVGGTMLEAPLYGPDRKIYALAQGQLSVGGYIYDLNGNIVQKNHPTAGVISEGAIMQVAHTSGLLNAKGNVNVLLDSPDITTASRVADDVNSAFGKPIANAVDAGMIQVHVPSDRKPHLVSFLAHLENVVVVPDQSAVVVVNERTGTVIAGGDVRISKVSVTHGDTRVSIVTDYDVSQPGLLINPGINVGTAIVPRTRINVHEQKVSSVSLPSGTTVADLVTALNKVKTNARDIIAILQGIRRAGALHAQLIIQ